MKACEYVFFIFKLFLNFKKYLLFMINYFDYLVMHQANMLMNESIRKKLKLEKEKVPYSLKDYGNTSSASIPLTLVHALKNELISKEVNLILAGFGVGLSWGSVALRTNRIVCLDVVEIENIKSA